MSDIPAPAAPVPETRAKSPGSRRVFAAGLLCCLAAVLGFAVWKLALESRFVAKRWGVVEAGKIYRSGQLSPHLVKSTYAKHGIQVVIDLTGEEPASVEQQAERQAIAELGITSLRFPLIGDGTGDVEQYAGALEALACARKKGQPVVVHCHAGSQRTGGVVAAYRLLFENASAQSVVEELQRFGWRPGRDEALRNYLNTHLPGLSRRLVEDGTLAETPRTLPRL